MELAPRPGFVACRATGARVRWLHRLGAVSTTRPPAADSLGGGAKAELVTLVAPYSRVSITGRETAPSGRPTAAAAVVTVEAGRQEKDEERERRARFAPRISRSSRLLSPWLRPWLASRHGRGTRPNKAAPTRGLRDFREFIAFYRAVRNEERYIAINTR